MKDDNEEKMLSLLKEIAANQQSQIKMQARSLGVQERLSEKHEENLDRADKIQDRAEGMQAKLSIILKVLFSLLAIFLVVEIVINL